VLNAKDDTATLHDHQDVPFLPVPVARTGHWQPSSIGVAILRRRCPLSTSGAGPPGSP
jgi:hypothetical protein